MKTIFLRSFQLALLYTVCLLLSYTRSYGQDSCDTDPIFEVYEQGYHQSMRDVFSILESHSEPTILQRVKKGMLIDIQDPSLNTMKSTEWVQYYYKHQQQIQYYPQWGAFLRNDLDIPNLPYAVLDDYSDPKLHIIKARSIYNAITQKALKKVIPIIESLSLPEIIYSQRILLDCLKLLSESYSCEKISRAYATISAQLLILNDQFVHQKIEELVEQKDCSVHVTNTISSIISSYKDKSYLYKTIPKNLESYRNSQFIAHLKEQHYTKALAISSVFFDDKADYYGKLLSALALGQTVDEDEIIYLLIKSESPKALYYIISRWYVYAKKEMPRAKQLMDILTAFIDSNIQVNTPDGRAFKCDSGPKDLVAKKSILAFWINNYEHYEWNDDVHKFVNKNILKKDRQELVQLYKNLNNKNAEFALKSYWKLVHSDPVLLAEVDKIYSKKLLNYNRSLPSRKYKYLIQLARLVQYSKTNGIEYRVDKHLQPALYDLINATAISEIIRCENVVIGLLNTNNITAFEVWAIVNSGKEHIKYSSTRITNLFYKKHLDQIVSSPIDLNLFLKKSSLFKNFGDHGSNKYYLAKIVNAQNINLPLLTELKNESLDEDILSSIDYIINYINRTDQSINRIDFHEFLKSPSSFKTEEMSRINKPSKSELNKLMSNFDNKFSSEAKFILLEWINLNTPKELLSFVVSLQSKDYSIMSGQNIELPIKDFANQILSTYISKDDISDKPWSKEYIKVFKEIFDQDLHNIINSTEVSIETINNIINSKYYTINIRPTIISALAKVNPARNIIACNLSEKLSIEELKFLLPKIKSKKGLDYLLKITNVEENDAVMSFIIAHERDKGTTAAGKYFNALFKKQWFTEYIDSQTTSSELKIEIQWILTNYWENEEGLSSFEEEQTVLNIIKIELAGKPLRERLDLILASFVDNEVKLQTINKIIFQIEYDSIATLLEYYDQIVEIGGIDLYMFINEDFGIPLEDISDRELVFQLSNDLKNLSERDLYHKYLTSIGVDLFSSDKEFDTSKAYSIITEDLVRPFVGTGGSVRDIYVFGTIKLLEKEFNKTLGFHPKLNESQSFYKYTSKKRALAWATELAEIMPSEL